VVSFLTNPFACHNNSEIAASIARIIPLQVEELELEILDLKNDIVLQSYATDANFWNLVDELKFPCLRSVAYKVKACFSSTYLCESLFSTINVIKSKHRSRINDIHLDDCLRAGTSSYTPNFKQLVNDIQCQISH
jgi:hypothetical protein